jgi:ferrous iron transport protein A
VLIQGILLPTLFFGFSMLVSELQVGQTARIVALSGGHPAYRHKLLVMGLLPGTSFTVSRIAPLGDPIEIQVRGVSLSLRKNEANVLQIEAVQA